MMDWLRRKIKAISKHDSSKIYSMPEDLIKVDSSKIYSCIPEDLIIEILVRLPVKSILKFKSVSKSWCNLISGKDFVQFHLEFMLTNNTECLVRNINVPINKSGRSCMKLYPLNALLDKPCHQDNVTHETDFPLKGLTNTRLIGSCNGLCCVIAEKEKTREEKKERREKRNPYRRPECLFLWNPSTRMYRVLPNIDSETEFRLFLKFGIGFVGGDYKVLASYHDPVSSKYIVKLYSVITGSWKISNNFITEDSAKQFQGKFVNRKLYWYIKKTKSVFYFDLESEASGTVQPPENVDYFNSDLEVLGECLGLYIFRGTWTEVWRLEKHGLEDESWNKIVSIDLKSCPGITVYMPRPICMTKEGEILIWYNIFGKRTAFIIYDPKSKSFKPSSCYVKCSPIPASSSVYVPSLISPFPYQ